MKVNRHQTVKSMSIFLTLILIADNKKTPPVNKINQSY